MNPAIPAVFLFVCAVTIATATTVTVDTVTDELDGDTSSIANLIATPGGTGISLREAVSAANNTAGADEILFDAGLDTIPIVLDIAGTGEDANVDGDLDIIDPDGLTITGNGEANTILDDNADERVLHSEINSGDLTLTDLTVRNGNDAGSGGGLRNRGSNLTITRCTFTGNICSSAGGGFDSSGTTGTTLTVTDSTISHNTSTGSNGGGFDCNTTNGTITITGCTITGNSADRDAGGFEVDSSDVISVISDCTISGNMSGGSGGGISHDSTGGRMIIERCTISGNSAENGGGIDNDGDLVELRNSTLSGNTALEDGGGIFHDETDGIVTLTNSTLSGNAANRSGGGIALEAFGGFVDIRFSTLTGNLADDDADGAGEGGGIDITQSSGTPPVVTIINSIIQGNDDETAGDTTTDDCANSGVIGSYVSNGGNVFGLNTGCPVTSGDTTGAALLDPLAANGGPTQTHALLGGSAAIDFTTTVPEDLDQRGVGRFDGSPDAGAFEAGGTLTIVTTADDVVDGDTSSVANLASTPGAGGEISLREAITAANNTAGGDTILFSSAIDGTPIVLDIGATGEDLNADGDIDVTDAGGLAISGNGGSRTILDGNSTERVLDHRDGDLFLYGLTVRNGFEAANEGGGIRSDAATAGALILERVTINGNETAGSRSSGQGGGIDVRNGTTTLEFIECVIVGNTASNDGGGANLRSDSGRTDLLRDCEIIGNHSGANGGGIAFTGNHANLEMIDCLVDGNQGKGEGGGLEVDTSVGGGTHSLTRCTISNNQSGVGSVSQDGGGIEYDSSSGSLTISQSTITGNAANGSSATGGGLNVNSGSGATLTVVNSTISGNRADHHGGGINHSTSDSTINLDHVTITDNIADFDADGNGDGGGINVEASNLTTNIANSIVQGNDDATPAQTDADDCANSGGGTYVTLGGNVFGDGAGCAPGPDDTTGPANLLPLAKSEPSSTLRFPDTHRLGSGSAAINFAGGSVETVDARGYPRSDGLPDAGAVELQFRVLAFSAYPNWVAFHGLTPGVNDGLFADPNGDGDPNYKHFAFDENPLTGASDGKFAVEIAEDGGQDYLTLTFPTVRFTSFSGAPPKAAKTGLIYTIRADEDLAGDDLIAVEVSPALSAGLPALSDTDGSGTDWEYNTFRLPDPVSALDMGFLWVEVEPQVQNFENP